MGDRCFDEAFCLAVGPWRIGLGADVLDPRFSAGFAEGMGFVAGTIIRHNPGDGYPQSMIISDSRFEKGHRTFLFLVWINVSEGDAGIVVYADMQIFPSIASFFCGAGGGLALAGAGHPVTGPLLGGSGYPLSVEDTFLLDEEGSIGLIYEGSFGFSLKIRTVEIPISITEIE